MAGTPARPVVAPAAPNPCRLTRARPPHTRRHAFLVVAQQVLEHHGILAAFHLERKKLLRFLIKAEGSYGKPPPPPRHTPHHQHARGARRAPGTCRTLTRRLDSRVAGKSPYHNSVHGADVLLGVHYFLSRPELRGRLSELQLLATLLAACAPAPA